MLPPNINAENTGGGARSLQRFRRDAGYRTAKDFARAVGVPYTTYARYEGQDDGPDRAIPMPMAWRLADALGCTIDELVGRGAKATDGGRVQRLYDRLTPGSRARMDEYLDFIAYREHMVASQGRWS